MVSATNSTVSHARLQYSDPEGQGHTFLHDALIKIRFMVRARLSFRSKVAQNNLSNISKLIG